MKALCCLVIVAFVPLAADAQGLSPHDALAALPVNTQVRLVLRDGTSIIGSMLEIDEQFVTLRPERAVSPLARTRVLLADITAVHHQAGRKHWWKSGWFIAAAAGAITYFILLGISAAQ